MYYPQRRDSQHSQLKAQNEVFHSYISPTVGSKIQRPRYFSNTFGNITSPTQAVYDKSSRDTTSYEGVK